VYGLPKLSVRGIFAARAFQLVYSFIFVVLLLESWSPTRRKRRLGRTLRPTSRGESIMAETTRTFTSPHEICAVSASIQLTSFGDAAAAAGLAAPSASAIGVELDVLLVPPATGGDEKAPV